MISVVVAYLAALLVVAIALWLLFLWQRPNDAGGAMLWEAAHSGFWQAVSWIALVAGVVVLTVPLLRGALRRS